MTGPRHQQSSTTAIKKRGQLEAGVTGGGIGTAIAGFASLVQDPFWKQCLVLAAPSIGIAAAALYSFLVRMYINPWIQVATTNRLLKHFSPLLTNTSLSEAARKEIQDQLEQAILANIRRYSSD